MIPVRAQRGQRHIPVVTYTIVALNVIIYLWDRQGHLFGGSVTFSDLTMRASDLLAAIAGRGDRVLLITPLTSMFLHANLLHIAGNMLFLTVFGAAVELALGPFQYMFLYLLWGLVAAGTQVAVDPHSTVSVLGASGAIGGVMGCYFLLFPSSKIEILVPILAFFSFEVSAWVLLGAWFLYQILGSQEGVANWAHAGGFLAGMLTVLAKGGRASLFRGREQELEAELFT